MMMRARHLFSAPSGKVKSSREKSRAAGSMLQMKRCNDDIPARMAEVPLFANLPESERRDLVSNLNVRIRAYAKGEMIVNECDPAADVLVVLKGCLFVYECGVSTDRRHLVCYLRQGDTYGATFPVLMQKFNPGMVTAGCPSEVLLCSVSAIRSLIAKGSHSALIANLYAAAARQGYAAWRKVALLSCYEIADRIRLYRRQLREDGLSDSALPPPAELAEYLGVNRTALYRALGELK